MANPEDKRKGKQMKNERSLAANEEDYSLDALFERFYFTKKAERRAKGTLQNYRRHYDFFAEYMDIRGMARRPSFR